MKKGAKENDLLGFAGGLLIDQLIVILVYVLLVSVFSFFPSKAQIIQNIFSFLIFFAICYVDAWKRGDADNNRVRIGVSKKNLFKGLYAGFIASVPMYILALFAFLAEINAVSFFDFLGSDVFTSIMRFIHAPVVGFMKDAINQYPSLNFVLPLFVCAISGLGYIMGLKRITIKQIFMYKNSSDEFDSDDEDE